LGGAARNYGAAGGGALGGILAARKHKGLIGGFMQGPSGGTVKDMIVRSTVGAAEQNRLASLLRPGISSGALRDLANSASLGDVQYSDMTKRIGKVPSMLSKVPHISKLRGMRVPVLKSLKNFKDPRVKLLAAILGGATVGGLAQSGLEGSV